MDVGTQKVYRRRGLGRQWKIAFLARLAGAGAGCVRIASGVIAFAPHAGKASWGFRTLLILPGVGHNDTFKKTIEPVDPRTPRKETP